jgi:hypothetical protein
MQASDLKLNDCRQIVSGFAERFNPTNTICREEQNTPKVVILIEKMS